MSSKQSIKLYESLKRLPKPQFDEVCFYLQKKYHYDLSLIPLDKVPFADSAMQLIYLLEQNTQGFNHLQKVLEEVIHGKTTSIETPNLDNQFDKKRLIVLLSDCPSLRDTEKRQSILTLLPTNIADNINIGNSIKDDVLELVNKCINYPDGIKELFEAVRFFDEGTEPFQTLSDFLAVQELTPESSPIGILEKVETPITELMAQLHLSSQVKASDEFTRHNHDSLQLVREAMVQLKQLSPQIPEYSRVSLIVGSALSSTGELLQAARLFTQVIENTDKSSERAIAHFNLFQVQLRRKIYPAALENLQAAIKINPQYALHDLHKYPIERLLGAGGMGCVFLCQNQNRLIRYTRVVVKCFWEHPKGTLDEVFKEPFAMRDIAGDYIPEPLDFGYVDVIKQERAYFVTAYIDDAIDGEAWLEKYGPMNLEMGLQVGLQIAKGLQIAHDAGICHLDLKPANILLTQTDNEIAIRIIDFGLSQVVPSLQQKAMTVQKSRAGLSQFGQAIFGTLDYACPEQQGFTQYGKPGVQCDVFSFGKTLYRFLTGKIPRTLHPKRLANAPDLFELLCDCVDEEPNQRPESAQLLISRLTEQKQQIEDRKIKEDENAWQADEARKRIQLIENEKLTEFQAKEELKRKKNGKVLQKKVTLFLKVVFVFYCGLVIVLIWNSFASYHHIKNGGGAVTDIDDVIDINNVIDNVIEQSGTVTKYRYTDNYDGAVTDNRSGLIWLKNANCFGLQDLETAMQSAANLADGQCGLSDGSKPGDWRLPTEEEWRAMVAGTYIDRENSQPALSNAAGTDHWKEGDAFSDVQTDGYWSSSSTSVTSVTAAYAWCMDISFGDDFMCDKSNTYYVWPVRGDVPANSWPFLYYKHPK